MLSRPLGTKFVGYNGAMRLNIVHPGAGELHYEIREIVTFAQQLAETGIPIIWENIGDPVAKGEAIPQWILDIVADEVMQNTSSLAYSPTKGLASARTFLSEQRRQEGKLQLDPENILFFNGLGDAINKVYTWLHPGARILGPNPAYPTHSALEAAHSHAAPLTYSLDPTNGWWPDVADVRRQVDNNPDVAGLLIINPDNPTGMVYPRHILKEFVAIAKQYKLFLIADEIYYNLTFNPQDFVSLAELADGVPTIVMRGLSKEIPWPGSRCGWTEFYNLQTDPDFARYVRSIEEAKMVEVCSTTLPQSVMPIILSDDRYADHLRARRDMYHARAVQATKILGSHANLSVVEPKAAFYLSVTFSQDFMKTDIEKPAANRQAQKLLEAILKDVPLASFDKRFCYQLLASTGICTVPLSTGFNSSTQGFRMTLLEDDSAVFRATLQSIKDFVS